MADGLDEQARQVLSGERSWHVCCGDSAELLRLLPDACVDLIVTDPPHGHNHNDGDVIANREKALGVRATAEQAAPRPIANDGEEADPLFQTVMAQSRRLLRSGGCCCCCCGGGGPDPQFARWSLWMDEHLDFKQMVVWDKGPMGMGWHYRRSYECVLVATKPGGACKWYDQSGKVENIIRPGHRVLGSSVRKIIPRADDHPTPKPWQLAAEFVRLHSQAGDLVLDPFAGHGWVGEACVRMGRRYLGIEIDAGFVDAARAKIAEAAGDGDGFMFSTAHGGSSAGRGGDEAVLSGLLGSPESVGGGA